MIDNPMISSHARFRREPIFPIKIEINTLRTTQEVGLDLTEAQIRRLQQINELDEI